MLSDHVEQLLQRIDKSQAIIAKNRPLPPSILERLREQLVIDWTFNSNAIEGNTLSLYETKLVLEDGLTIGRKSLKEHLETVMDDLPPREVRILQLRYGILDGQAYTLEEVGRKMGVTRERVRQIEAQALSRLRHPAIRRKLREYLG